MKTKTRRPRQTARARLMQRLDLALDALMRAELLKRSIESESAYLFKHALVQETAESTLLRGEHKRLHLLVARALERVNAENLDVYAAELAQHYGEAGDDAKTLTYAMRAGDIAARVYANAEAIQFYTEAIEIARRLGGAALQELYLKRGRAFELGGQYQAALTNYAEMESYAQARGDGPMELSARLARATLYIIPTPLQNPSVARELLDQALALARGLEDHAAESKTLWNLMLVEYFWGQPARAVEWGEQALRIAREYDLREQMAYVLNDIARPYIGVARFEDASAALRQARALWQAQGNLPMLADNLSAEMWAASWLGEYAQAIAFAEQVERTSRPIGNLWNLAYSGWIKVWVLGDQGEFDKALAETDETIELAQQAGFGTAEWVVRVYAAFLLGKLGAPARGITVLEPHFEDTARTASAFRFLGLGVLAYLYLLIGREDRFRFLLELGWSEANRDDILNLVPVGLTLAEGEWAMSQLDFEGAERIAQPVLSQYRAKNIHPFRADVLLLAAKALRAQNKRDATREMLLQARAEAEMVGVRRVLWEILVEQSAFEADCGNFAAAQAAHAQAREILEYLIAHTPPDVRASFLNLPRVREVMA